MTNYGELLFRIILSFTTILIITRILGKKTMANLTYFDYIAGITLGTIAASMTYNLDIPWINTFLALICFGAIIFLLSVLTLESRPARKIIGGEPAIVIHGGKILEDNMTKLRYNMDNLMLQLRQKDVFDISEVEFAILERDGRLSVQKKSQYHPVTPHDLKIPTGFKGISTELIIDGSIIEQNLQQLNLDKKWLMEQLKSRNLEPEEVNYASLASNGHFYVDSKRDNLVPGQINNISD